MIETEAIVNSRPLTIETAADGTSEASISPSNLLTMKSKVIMPPSGSFGRPDLYSRRRWRRIQHIADEFWNRWRKEFLTSLQSRSKWNVPRRNLKIGGIVLLKEGTDRNHWPLAKVVECEADKNGFVCTVKLQMGNDMSTPNQVLRKPIDKTVLIVENENVDSPTREPLNA